MVFYLKLRKKDYQFKIQEIRHDQISHEISKKQHENDLIRRNLEEQKIKLEQEDSRIKSEREKLSEEYRRLKIEQENLAIEARRIIEDKIFIEQEKNKLQQRIQNVKEKFQEVINKIDQKNGEVENRIIKLESEKKAFELEKAKLETAKKEAAEENKHIKSEWQKISLEKDRLDQLKNVLNKKEKELSNTEQQLLEGMEFINDEKDGISKEQQEIEAKKEDIEKQSLRLDERQKEIDEKERQLNSEKDLVEGEKKNIEKERKQVELESQDIENRSSELHERENRLKKEIQQKCQKLKKRKSILVIQKNKIKSQSRKLKTVAEKIKDKRNWNIEAIEKILREIEELFPTPDQRPKTRIMPELICQKKAGCWQLAIKISGRLPDCSNLKIIQDDLNLVKDEANEDYWPLNSMAPIFIEWKDGNRSKRKKFELQEDGAVKPVLFKLLSKNDNIGKFVNAPSMGSYFAIVPENWVREESLSGSAASAPENINIKGFEGHFFILKKAFNFIIAFRNSSGELISIEPKGSRFELKGNLIIDANEEAEPLFGGKFPTIIDSIKSWNDVQLITIEEVTDEIDGHKWIFTPEINFSEIDLNQVELQGDIPLSQSTSSSFLISFYDKKYHLIDNLYFRYIQGLKKIRISDHQFVPSTNGHGPVDIHFYHDKDCKIELKKNEYHKVIVKSNAEETIATIPPDSSWDLTDWEVKDSNGRKVNIELLVERIWWNLANEKDPLISNDWSYKPLDIPKEYLLPTSPHIISLKLPKIGWIKNVYVGIDKRNRKEYKVNTNQRSIQIPLRDFCDYQKISKLDSEAKLLLWINKAEFQGSVPISTIKAITPPPPPPPSPPPQLDHKPCCYNCDHARIKFKIYWCRRYNWPQHAYDSDYFLENIAHFKCGEWRGEYKDENEEWTNK